MKRLIALLLIMLLLSSLTLTINSCEDGVVGTSNIKDKPITYMFAGYDEAGQNTDSIILANYCYSNNTISFLQIPRDTYYKDAPLGKINSLFPDEINKGRDQGSAMLNLREHISDSLGVVIGSHVGYSTKTFKDLIDAIGGVSLTLKKELKVTDSKGNTILNLTPGDNLLMGEEALLFVRARSEYIRGDLGRVDAQKLFIAAFIKKLQNDITAKDIISAFISCKTGWALDAKIGDFFKILSLNQGRLKNIKVNFATIPGEAVQDLKGIWYYSVSKSPTENMLSVLGFYRKGGFDINQKLLNKKSDSFAKIYFGNYTTQIYDMSSLVDIDILTR